MSCVFYSSSILMESKKTLIIFLCIAKYWEVVQFAATWTANPNREIVLWSYRCERGLNSVRAYMQTVAYAPWPQPDPLPTHCAAQQTRERRGLMKYKWALLVPLLSQLFHLSHWQKDKTETKQGQRRVTWTVYYRSANVVPFLFLT